jgi:hypothetical protein
MLSKSSPPEKMGGREPQGQLLASGNFVPRRWLVFVFPGAK